MFLFLSFYFFSNAQIILANEIAVSNDDWQAGDGFNAWEPNYGTSTGRYVGNPGDAGLRAPGTFMILSPKKAQAQSTPSDLGEWFGG